MKKQEKIDLIEKSIAEKEICRCFFLMIQVISIVIPMR